MPNKTIVKTPEQVIADHFGYCTLEMLRGNCKSVAEDPLQDLCTKQEKCGTISPL